MRTIGGTARDAGSPDPLRLAIVAQRPVAAFKGGISE
jgi:hypothetical protein